jgi:hypothetical protein
MTSGTISLPASGFWLRQFQILAKSLRNSLRRRGGYFSANCPRKTAGEAREVAVCDDASPDVSCVSSLGG